jgi:DNA-binding IclR family transcriptional regulator
MACISPDGKPTESGSKMLRALQAGAGSPEEIANKAGLPLFRVRSGLRELAEAGLTKQKDDRYELSEEGAKLI